MEIFQSWANIAIPSAILIAYIATYIHQRNVIKSKNETIEDLKTQVAAANSINNMQGTSFNMYKDMYKLSDLKEHIELQVSVRLSDAVDRVIADTAHIMATDSKILERATLY